MPIYLGFADPKAPKKIHHRSPSNRVQVVGEFRRLLGQVEDLQQINIWKAIEIVDFPIYSWFMKLKPIKDLQDPIDGATLVLYHIFGYMNCGDIP